jgi:pilus assembly protein Flp/PilA
MFILIIDRERKMKLISLFYKNEHGGGMVEYVLIVALIALAAIAAITTVGTKLNTSYENVSSKL